MMEKECGNCRHYHRPAEFVKDPTSGVCRRRAPHTFSLPGGTSRTRFPVVREEWVCGEHESIPVDTRTENDFSINERRRGPADDPTQ